MAPKLNLKLNPIAERDDLQSHEGTQEKRLRSRSSNLKDELIHVLDTTEGFDAFYEFLKEELAIENLVFWKTSREYRKNFGKEGITHAGKPQTSEEYARYIYQEFIADDAPLQVNIGFEVRDKLDERFAPPDSSRLSKLKARRSKTPRNTTHTLKGSMPTISIPMAHPHSADSEVKQEQRSTKDMNKAAQSIAQQGSSKNLPLTGKEYEEAERVIMRVMLRDTYRRFRNTAKGRLILKSEM
jgi:hypothetical protein